MKKSEAAQLLRAIFAGFEQVNSEVGFASEKSFLCQENRYELHVYIEAELDHRNAAILYPDLHTHIAQCFSCQVSYQELKELMQLEYANELVTPPTMVNFDLSYLNSVEEPLRHTRPESGLPGKGGWQLNAIGHYIFVFSEQFIESLKLSTIQPSFQKYNTERTLFEAKSPPLVKELNVEVMAKEERRDADYCTLVVTADIPGKSWPQLGGTNVSLWLEGEIKQTRLTDAHGKAIFYEIRKSEMTQLVIEVHSPSGKRNPYS